MNRPDLLKVDDQGFHQYGEGRFVFGAFDIDNPATLFPFFVIMEFGIPAASCADTLEWANRSHALSNWPEPSSVAITFSPGRSRAVTSSVV